MNAIEQDDERHKREEAERRAYRQSKRDDKNKSAAQKEKERKRKEYVARILKEKGQKPPSSSSKKPLKKKSKRSSTPSKSSSTGSTAPSSTSAFQALFAQRAGGFLIDLSFRNAPPRPPVGPCFVGPGLDGALHDQWTTYRANNSLEESFSFPLHSEPDLGVPLAPSAMDSSCYIDPLKEDSVAMFEEEEDLPPQDAALLDWKGSMGDSSADALQTLRDRARAAALLGKLPTPSSTTNQLTKLRKGMDSKKGFTSRVLKEAQPFFMKKTTYLDNDVTRSVHTFESLAMAKQKEEKRIAKQLEESKKKSAVDMIEESFTKVVQKPTQKRAHPTKKTVVAEWEIPLVPDMATWGHTFTHVVMDKLPTLGPPTKRRKVSRTLLEKSFLADVITVPHSKRRQCHLLIDKNPENKEGLYAAAQLYDFHIHHLKAEDGPHVNFILKVDPKNKIATYHPISNRIQLTSGRPADRKRTKRTIEKRPMKESERVEMEKRVAEIDIDLAKKYGLFDEGSGKEMDVTPTDKENGDKVEPQKALGGEISSDSETGF